MRSVIYNTVGTQNREYKSGTWSYSECLFKFFKKILQKRKNIFWHFVVKDDIIIKINDNISQKILRGKNVENY